MALATINGLDVLEATIRMPRRGRWTAKLAVAADSAGGLEGPVAIALGDALTLQGTTKRVGAFAGSVTLRAVGGAGGLWKTVQPKAYQSAPLRLPLQDVLGEVGEQLAASSDPDVLGVQLRKWARFGGTAFEEVESLMRAAGGGAAFRFLPDGSVWIGRETWPDSGLQQGQDFSLLDDMRWCGQVELGVETPTLLPGTTLLGRHVDLVEHRITAQKVRTLVTFADDEDPAREPDPATEGQVLLRMMDRRLRPTWYHATYPAKVVAQNPDGSLELRLDDSESPGLSGVPMRSPWPGVSAKVAPGSRVAVVFEEGNPQKQAAGHFEPSAGQLQELEVSAAVSEKLTAPLVQVGDGSPGSQVLLGGSGAVDSVVKGTAYRLAEAASNAAVQAALTAQAAYYTAAATAWGAAAVLPPASPASPNPTMVAAATAATAAAAACTSAAAAIGTMEGNATTYLSQIARTS